MANLYFCQSNARNQGMLRAVLSIEESNHLVTPGSAIYVGDQFPARREIPGEARDFAVLSIGAEEADAEWRPGFYRFDADLMVLSDGLRNLEK